MTTAFSTSNLPGLSCKRGKVRDIYDLDEQLLIVTTDRISAFDWILPNSIPHKGRVLHSLTVFWLQRLQQQNCFITENPVDLIDFIGLNEIDPHLIGRSMLVIKTRPFPVECIVRGYLAGSGWKEYQRQGTVCGIKLSPGLLEGSILPEPIFTPSTKADDGHDRNITFDQMCKIISEFVGDSSTGNLLSNSLKTKSINLYKAGAKEVRSRGIIIADTKFEFGLLPKTPVNPQAIALIDEVLTPDSSRFWPVDQYCPGQPQPSFDKQFVRDWLTQTGWDKNSSPPVLPTDIVEQTSDKYIESYERITEARFPWKH